MSHSLVTAEVPGSQDMQDEDRTPKNDERPPTISESHEFSFGIQKGFQSWFTKASRSSSSSCLPHSRDLYSGGLRIPLVAILWNSSTIPTAMDTETSKMRRFKEAHQRSPVIMMEDVVCAEVFMKFLREISSLTSHPHQEVQFRPFETMFLGSVSQQSGCLNHNSESQVLNGLHSTVRSAQLVLGDQQSDHWPEGASQ